MAQDKLTKVDLETFHCFLPGWYVKSDHTLKTGAHESIGGGFPLIYDVFLIYRNSSAMERITLSVLHHPLPLALMIALELIDSASTILLNTLGCI